MAYVGTTAASSVSNPPVRISQGTLSQPNINESTSIVRNGGNVWTYNSTNQLAAIVTTGYFTDGHLLGIRPGDFLLANTWSTQASSAYILFYGVFGAVSTNGASLSTEAFITSTATAAGGG